jgi:hypothetical protein
MPNYGEWIFYGEIFAVCLFVLALVVMVWGKPPSN